MATTVSAGSGVVSTPWRRPSPSRREATAVKSCRPSKMMASTRTEGTPRRAAVSAPTGASPSCSTRSGRHSSARRSTGSASRPVMAANIQPTPSVPLSPRSIRMMGPGCRSMAPPNTRPTLTPGATSCVVRPALRAASSPASPVANSTSWPASRNAVASGTSGSTCPTRGLATKSALMRARLLGTGRFRQGDFPGRGRPAGRIPQRVDREDHRHQPQMHGREPTAGVRRRGLGVGVGSGRV
jgi:hypothetical protein